MFIYINIITIYHLTHVDFFNIFRFPSKLPHNPHPDRNVLNSLFLEAPYMAKRLPEGASLSTYLLVAQQIASLIVLIPTQFWSNGARRFYPHIILTTFVVSVLSCIVLIFWSLETINKFSIVFLAIAVITSILGYISTTYYFPFVSLYRVRYTNSYTLGLGFNLAFTAIISLIQDSGGDNPRFNHKIYFVIILISHIVAFIGVLWILFSDAAKTQLVSYVPPGEQQEDKEPCTHQLLAQQGTSISKQIRDYETKYPPAQVGYYRKLSSWRVLRAYIFPPLVQGLLAFLAFGIVPSLLPFAAGSYYKGSSIYMYSVSLLYIVDPVARALYSLRVKEFARVRHIGLMTGLCLVFGFLICLLAGMSPKDTWIRDNKNGGAIPITLAILCGFTYAAAFTGSYTIMFNIGTEVDDDKLYSLEVEKRKSDKQLKQEHETPTASNTSRLVDDASVPSSPTADIELQDSPTTEKPIEDNAIVDVAKDHTGPCPLCDADAARRDALRQIIYRLSGFALQFGSCAGTFIGAALAVFTSTIPEPVPYVPVP